MIHPISCHVNLMTLNVYQRLAQLKGPSIKRTRSGFVVKPRRGRSPSFPIQEIYSWLGARIFPQIQLPILSLSLLLPDDAKSLFGCRTERLPSSHERPFKCIGARARLRFVFVTLKSISRPIASHLALSASIQLPTS